MFEANQSFDPFVIKYKEQEFTYPWNNGQLNFDIINQIETNKEEKQDIEITISERTFSDDEENNYTQTENENEIVIYLAKTELNYVDQTIKTKKEK